MPTFRGFSTAGKKALHKMDWRLYDEELIRRDLLNVFMTRIGERIMRPDYGCAIWNYLEEPMTAGNVQAINDEAVRVCGLDERVAIQNVNLLQFENGLRVEIQLLNVMNNVVFIFTADFEARQTAYYNGSLTN